ncbi:hypothetical protein J4573_08495 [Actinomadura barringtoniae]|uniref:Uncharacterized protein n=1 Tax=Actinomadura barringtoniae TaxID=1427535 RepID=A0A939PBQ1_9ACTN|nr:hypothetical protein [Actinomadura barringtoniae]MBO2447123.1 hypothetical protein [Actinomadura barringtoniae]
MTDQHPDPITEGLAQGGQRIVQIAALGTALKQWESGRRQRQKAVQLARDEATRRKAETEQRAESERARAVWAPAHDRQWLRQADLPHVAAAWCAAVPYAAEGRADAGSAVRKCEDRLRDLHPHAMSHYDRLRIEGIEPLDAMQRAAPFFQRDPNVRDGAPVRTRELSPGTGTTWAANQHGPSREERESARAEQRAHRILDEFVTRLSHQGRTHIPPSELRTLLDVTTNLPSHVIDKVVQARAATQADIPGPTRTAAEVSADNFPHSIAETMAETTSTGAPPPKRLPIPSADYRPRPRR